MSKIYVVGIGPGSMEDMTPRARKAMEASDIIIGYGAYIELIKEYFPGKSLVSSGMTREVERCGLVLEKALEGKTVALISSGDSGIYGMAGIMLEVVNKSGRDVPVEVIPGITAANGAAALLGAPIMHDFAVISLSDLLTPWELIRKRLECAAAGDFVLCLYNPKSRQRSEYIGIARDILLKSRDGKTPVGIVRNVGRQDESYVITTLEDMLQCEIDMFTVVLVGNSKTYVENGRMITPRGYTI
ncbi:MAG: precorrin-3B C(17)-methyltransferase [Clostridiales bacterium]|jgi:precorrin-3B C17-methyltransferase|nr:precorrin-3B C(17)-methyltransferase [Eubacteriales bacterium]MDH7565731.1 precorrin-3B C(17)-methyltransferase [Clostridiales bacterium]